MHKGEEMKKDEGDGFGIFVYGVLTGIIVVDIIFRIKTGSSPLHTLLSNLWQHR